MQQVQNQVQTQGLPEQPPLPNLVDIGSLPDYATPFAEFCRDNAVLINSLSGDGANIRSMSHWALVDEMKGVLGAAASNDSTDDEEQQDQALYAAEGWVSDELSDAGPEGDVAMALFLKGAVDGTMWLSNEITQQSRSRDRQGLAS